LLLRIEGRFEFFRVECDFVAFEGMFEFFRVECVFVAFKDWWYVGNF
jgi:hypothetical protein